MKTAFHIPFSIFFLLFKIFSPTSYIYIKMFFKWFLVVVYLLLLIFKKRITVDLSYLKHLLSVGGAVGDICMLQHEGKGQKTTSKSIFFFNHEDSLNQTQVVRLDTSTFTSSATSLAPPYAFFHCVCVSVYICLISPCDWIQVIRLISRHLYLLSHHTGTWTF